MPYIFLAFAIVAEVVATTALKASAEFTKPVPLASSSWSATPSRSTC